MKFLICSDIHGNFQALKEIKPYLSLVDKAICLGDIVGYSCAVNECIDFLRDNKFSCIQGNHERYLIEGMDNQKKMLNESVRFGINVAKKCITKDNLRWLSDLPISIGICQDNREILFVHGSPFDPLNEYVYENTFDCQKFSRISYDVIALGHTHRELLKKIGPKLVFNPGSVGQARDYEGQVCFSIYDSKTNNIQRFRLSYDYCSNLELSKKMGGLGWIYKHYQTLL